MIGRAAVCALFVLVRSSNFDGASLLQQDMSASAGLQQAVATVMDMLAEDSFAEAPLIRSLLAMAREGKQVPDGVNPIFQQVVDLIDTLLADYKPAKEADEGILSHLLDMVQNCMTYGKDADDAAAADADAHKANHTTCRQAELSLDADTNEKCLLMENFHNSHHSGPSLGCHAPTPTGMNEVAGNPGQFKNWMDTTAAWFTTAWNSFKDDWQPCTTSRTALHDKQAECHGEQSEYETVVCSQKNARNAYCNGRQICYDAAKETYERNQGKVKEVADDRVEQVAMLKHVKCIVQTLMTGVFDVSACEAEVGTADFKADTQEYNVTYVATPELSSCSPISPVPGDADWVASAYADLFAMGQDATDYFSEHLTSTTSCPL